MRLQERTNPRSSISIPDRRLAKYGRGNNPRLASETKRLKI